METLVGQTLNRYQITSLLGEGGMGAVYKARDVTLQRDVAIKVMHAQFTRQQNFQERFLQEARVAARLDHPGIVKVYDFGEARGMLYIVMEFIPGQNLRKMLQKMREAGQWIVLDEAVKIIRQTSVALDYAHRQGVLHRDMKPDNIMLKPEPADGLPFRPVITDLGLAKLAGGGGVMTQDGTSMGTPAYMSPEQAMGEKTGPASDVYALGILLYELAAGRLPFPIRTLTEAIRYHVQEPPPDPRSIRPDLPEGITRVILKSIAKKPADRYADAAAFAQALGETMGAVKPAPVDTNLAQAVSLITQLQAEEARPRGDSLAQQFPKTPDNLTRDRIQVLEKEHTGKTVQVKSGGMNVGRDDDNDIVLLDTKASRRHARIEFDGSNYRVTDLNSTNGTFLGGARLLPGIPEIWTADKFVQIGDCYLRLERASAQASRSVNAYDVDSRRSGAMLSNGTMVDTGQIRTSGEGRVGIFVDPAPLTVAPGSSTQATVLVINQGPVVDQIRVTVSGLPPEWVSVSQPVVQLMPGDQKEITVSIRPPQQPQSRAGRYQAAFRVSSNVAPNQTAEARCAITVQPFTRFVTDMRPQRVRMNAPSRITVTNQGNLQETFQISLEDRANDLTFSPAQHRLVVGEGQSAVVEFRAAPRQRAWVGGETVTPFTLKVAASSGEPQVQSGELLSRALIPTWVITIIPVLFLCIIAAAIFSYTQVTGQQAASTATMAAAVLNAQATRNSQTTQVAIVALNQTQAAQGTQISAQSQQTLDAAAAALTQAAQAQTGTAQAQVETSAAFKTDTPIPPTPSDTPTPTSTPLPPGAWEGTWGTNCELLSCGNISMTQSGNLISGTYADGNGSLNGSLEGRRAHGTWSMGGATGEFDFWLSEDGKSWQGNWNKTFEWCGSREGTGAPSPCGIASWYGSWTTNCTPSDCGPMTLTQIGSKIVGTYASGGGQIEATVSGTQLTGEWIRGGGRGDIQFFMLPEGKQFNGNFDTSNQWCGFRTGASQPDPCLAKQRFDFSIWEGVFLSTLSPKLPIEIVRPGPFLVITP